MAAADSVQFKVTLNKDGNPVEIRRFTIDKDVVTNYSYLRQKLYSIFPVLQSSGMTILWKDSCDDMITIGSDEELIIALSEMAVLACKPLTINVPTPIVLQTGLGGRPNNLPATSHGSVVCDGCENPVIGYRYKCLACFDFDLCFDCEHKGLHSDHVMIRYPYPISRDMHFVRKLKKLHKHFNGRCAYDQPMHPHKMFKRGPKGGKCHVMSEDVFELVNDFVSALSPQIELTPEVLNQIIESLSNMNLSGSSEETQNASASTSNEPSSRKTGNSNPFKDGEKKGDQEHGRRKRGPHTERGFPPHSTPIMPVSSMLSNVMQQVGEAAPHIVPNILSVLNQISAGDAGYNFTPSNTAAPKETAPTTSSAPNEQTASTQTQSSPVEPMVVTVEGDQESHSSTTDKQSSATPGRQFIEQQLQTMLNMGFNNEGGWLRDTLLAKNGDITKVLDQLSGNGKEVRLDRLELD